MFRLATVRCHGQLQSCTSNGWCAHAVEKKTVRPSLHAKIHKLQTLAHAIAFRQVRYFSQWEKEIPLWALETATSIGISSSGKKKYQEIPKKFWFECIYVMAWQNSGWSSGITSKYRSWRHRSPPARGAVTHGTSRWSIGPTRCSSWNFNKKPDSSAAPDRQTEVQ